MKLEQVVCIYICFPFTTYGLSLLRPQLYSLRSYASTVDGADPILVDLTCHLFPRT